MRSSTQVGASRESCAQLINLFVVPQHMDYDTCLVVAVIHVSPLQCGCCVLLVLSITHGSLATLVFFSAEESPRRRGKLVRVAAAWTLDGQQTAQSHLSPT